MSPDTRAGAAEAALSALGGLARAVVRHRRGLVAAAAVYLAAAVASEIPSDALAAGLVALAVLLIFPRSRRLVWRPVGRWWLRRRWRLGCCHAGLVTPAGRIPATERRLGGEGEHEA